MANPADSPGAEILAVVGARPNMVKMAPLLHALADGEVGRVRLVHTGQHYDRSLSGGFIELLGMPEPDANLEVGSGTHAEQTAAVLIGIEKEIADKAPDLLVVSGDVNSTMAAAIAAAKAGVPVCHLESGLRSGDWTMPEEINRVVTDRISDLLLCTSPDAVENLTAEGISGDGVALVGNTMIDSLLRILADVDRASVLGERDLASREFGLVTLHRPALVDDPEQLTAAIDALRGLAAQMPVVFPVHPRTASRLEAAGVDASDALRILEPMDYPDFIALEAEARVVVTDSGGVQEETSAVGTPCLTYRTTTERPITCELGTNELVGTDPAALSAAIERVLAEEIPSEAPEIPLWDGAAGPRAAESIEAFLGQRKSV